MSSSNGKQAVQSNLFFIINISLSNDCLSSYVSITLLNCNSSFHMHYHSQNNPMKHVGQILALLSFIVQETKTRRALTVFLQTPSLYLYLLTLSHLLSPSPHLNVIF